MRCFFSLIFFILNRHINNTTGVMPIVVFDNLHWRVEGFKQWGYQVMDEIINSAREHASEAKYIIAISDSAWARFARAGKYSSHHIQYFFFVFFLKNK
jgi:hypothetical protein